jgi:hypothetical protein
MVETRHSDSPKELENLETYKEIQKIEPCSPAKAEAILKFYVKENFYYSTVNCLLRLARSSEEFRPCTVPFNETYQAIKHFHSLSSNRKGFRAYRGAKLKGAEVNALAIGSYVELLGFTSSSLDRTVAMRFMDEDSYLIVIEAEGMEG